MCDSYKYKHTLTFFLLIVVSSGLIQVKAESRELKAVW